MLGTPTYPGIYIEEIPSGVHPIIGVSTSDTAFIDYFAHGPVGVATRVRGFDDFLREFGPLDFARSKAGYAVMLYFINGGQVAWIVRVVSGNARASTLMLSNDYPDKPSLQVSAVSTGKWGDSLQVAVDLHASVQDDRHFNLVVRQTGQVNNRTQVIASEVYRDLTMDKNDAKYVMAVIQASSKLITVSEAANGMPIRPKRTGSEKATVTVLSVINHIMTPEELAETAPPGADPSEFPRNDPFEPLSGGDDGGQLSTADLIGGLATLERIEPAVVNLLCIPAAAELDKDAPLPADGMVESTPLLGAVAAGVQAFCEKYRCFYLLDIPESVTTTRGAEKWMAANNGVRDRNIAVAFPRLKIVDPDPSVKGLRDVGSSGTLAGIYARIDSTRGIWKAPAGIEANLRAVVTPAGDKLNDGDSATLNPLGINVIRNLPVHGTVSWGARTLHGADIQASEWKYVPIRRTAMYIEHSLAQGLRWVVFEPNDEPLWAQIRLNVGAFLQSMFRKGAFQGRTPREAYLVKCDSETTTQTDIDSGIVNILVGFAPLKPAEFVVIQIQQIAQPPDL